MIHRNSYFYACSLKSKKQDKPYTPLALFFYIAEITNSFTKKLFIIFALLVVILVIASFVHIVADTFATVPNVATTDGHISTVAWGIVSNPTGPQSTAMISLLLLF